jgi:DNA-binding LytR/AlgR family response regulator
LPVKQGNQRLFVRYLSIAGLYVEGDYVALITVDNKKYLLDQSLDKLEEALPGTEFFRLNRQYIINRELITGFEKVENGKLNILLSAFGSLPGSIAMGRAKAPAFKEWFERMAR